MKSAFCTRQMLRCDMTSIPSITLPSLQLPGLLCFGGTFFNFIAPNFFPVLEATLMVFSLPNTRCQSQPEASGAPRKLPFRDSASDAMVSRVAVIPGNRSNRHRGSGRSVTEKEKMSRSRIRMRWRVRTNRGRSPCMKIYSNGLSL